MRIQSVETTSEYRVIEFPSDAPTRADLELASQLAGKQDGSTRLKVDWLLSGNVRVESTSWVGLAQFSGFELRVLPKYVGEDLRVLKMLEFIGRVPLLKQLQSSRTFESSGTSLFELICALFINESQAILRDGLLHDYRPTEERLPAVRGRINYRDQMLKSFGQIDTLHCIFDEYDTDNVENQLIATALRVARSRIRDESLLRECNRLDAIFGESCNPITASAMWYDSRISYHRRNERYRTAHELAKIILEGTGFDDLFKSNGRTRTHAFFLNMNSIYESFIASLLKKCLDPSAYRVVRHERNRVSIVDAISGNRYTTLTPDIVVESIQTGTRIPIDMKYKLRARNQLSASDIYQTFTYALAFSSGNSTSRAGLIYPGPSAPPNQIEIRPTGLPIPARLCAVNLDVGAIAERIGFEPDMQTINEVRNAIKTIMS